MSLLRRIESARPGGGAPEVRATTPVAPGAPPSVPPRVPQRPARDSGQEVKLRLLNRIMLELDAGLDFADATEVRRQIQSVLDRAVEERSIVLRRAERELLLDEITDEIMGLGPIEPFLRDESITEVMVNGPRKVYIERAGKIEKTSVTFTNDEHVMRIIQRIIAPIGRRIDESSPMVDARLADGSRVNAIIPPLSLVGPVVTIRKFSARPYTVDDLIRFGTASPQMFDFLKACVQARLNTFVSGGTGSGKTTTLNVLSSFIGDDERIVTIEDAAELKLHQRHVVTLESRPPNVEGRGAISIRELLRNALHMRPDRIIVGECRGGEALDMLQAMNTGQDGSLSTGHANTPRDMLHRLETMVLLTGYELPLSAIREQLAAAVDLIVHTARLKDGSRKVVSITEVLGLKGDEIVTRELFLFEQTGVEDGKILGDLKPTGAIPRFVKKMQARGVTLPDDIFGPPGQVADEDAEAELEASRALAGYATAVKAGGMIYVSGMGPVDPFTGAVVGATIQDQTAQCLRNLKARLEAAGSSLDRIVWAAWSLRDPADFAGFDEEWGRWFAEGSPARRGLLLPAPQQRDDFRVSIGAIAAGYR